MADKKVRVKYEADVDDVVKAAGQMADAHDDALKDMEQQAKVSGDRISDVMKGSFAGSFLGNLAGNVATAGFGLITQGIAGVGQAMIGGNAQIETYSASFETLLGSQQKAKTLLDDLKDLGAETPFEFPELAEAGRNLVAFGFEADRVPDILRRVGDVASGVNAPVGELSELFGKARVSGTLYAEDIAQLVGRGIPVITEFANILGVSESQVKKLASEGKISYDVLEQALVNMTESGGQFAGMMEKQSQTFEGLQSTAQDVLGEIGRTIGKPMFDAAKQGLVGVLEWLQSPKVAETLSNIAEGIEDISSMFDSEGQAMQRVARQQRENLQNAINYNNKRIEELEGVEKLAKEYETYAGQTKLSADEQKRLEEISGQLNTTYPGLIQNTTDYAGNLDLIRQKSDEAAQATARLKTENDSLSKALAQTAINEARGKVREDFEGLIDAIDEYRDRIGSSDASAIAGQLPAGMMNLQGAVRGLTKLFGDDREEAHKFARSLLDNEDAMKAFGLQYRELSDASKGESPFLPYMAQIIEMVKGVQDGKAQIIDLKNQMNQPASGATPTGAPPVTPPAGDDDNAKKEREKKAREAFAASMAQLKREEEIELLRAQIADASEAKLEEIRAGYRQKRIDAAKTYAQASVDLEHDVTTATLKLQLEAHKKARDLADAEMAAAEERGEHIGQFLEGLQKDVDELEIDITPEIEKNERALREAVEAAQSHRAAVSGVFEDIEAAAGEGNAVFQAAAIGRATINTYEGATAAFTSAASVPIIGPVLGPIAAAAAIAAGLANVGKIANIKLAEGGVLNKPTFAIAGEAGPEFVAPMGKGADAIAERVIMRLGLSAPQRRTRVKTETRQSIDVRMGVNTIGRGGDNARIRRGAGVL